MCAALSEQTFQYRGISIISIQSWQLMAWVQLFYLWPETTRHRLWSTHYPCTWTTAAKCT